MEKQEAKSNFIKIDSILNRKDDQLPFGYFSPDSGGRVTWNCGHDPQNKIISVFCNDENGEKDKRVSIVPTITEALYIRDRLIEAGWQKLTPPEITVKYADGSEKPLNGKQKKYLKRQINKMQKDNPF